MKTCLSGMYFRKSLLVFSFIIFSMAAYSTIRLPSVVSSHMVLQQQSQSRIWGWADPAEKIYITTSWNNKTDSVTASRDAHWEILLPTPAAGGPYTITLKGWNTIVLEDILIGEVWVCSGQSNMEWSSYNNLTQMNEELPNSANSNIRLFHIPKTTSALPQDDCAGEWKVCSPEALKGFSAVGYFFGKNLQQHLNVPVGLINASWGGTPAEVWTPSEVVNGQPLLREAAAKASQTPWWPYLPGYAYNAMIYPVTGLNIAGAIWYQGESNTGTAATYSRLMKDMVTSWRKAWQKDFPFYYVQIAPYTYEYKNVSALLREQQAKVQELPNTGMVVITDLVDNIKDIHPQNKKDVSLRLANMALAAHYQKQAAPWQFPQYREMKIEKDKAMIYFENAPNGFMIKGGGKASEFFIAGGDRRFYPAEVKLEKDKLIITSKQVKSPVAIRFGFSNTAMPNLFSKEGLPVAPFRTDDWEVDTGKEN